MSLIKSICFGVGFALALVICLAALLAHAYGERARERRA